MHIIGIDNGNKNVKTVNCVFSSGLLQYPIKPAMTDDWICYGGHYYCLTPERINYTRDKTQDERFFILTLFAIVKELRARKAVETTTEIILGVGLPPQHLAELKGRFQQYFLRDNICFTYNDTDYCISIKKAVAFPQGYSAVASRMMKKDNPYVNYPTLYIVDMGGYTVDIVELHKGKVDLATCQSKENGVIVLYNEIAKQLRSKGIRIKEHVIDALLMDDTAGVTLPDGTAEYVKSLAQQHIDRLLRELKEEGYELDNYFTFFVGGGAVLLRNLIKKSGYVGKYSILNSVSANASGYEYLLRQFLK